MGATLREGLDAWHAKAEGNCAIDYGFHMIMADVNEGSLKEMEGLVGEGVTSFKLFMAYPGVFYSDDGQMLRAHAEGRRDRRADHHARRERHRDRRADRAGARPRPDRPALPRRRAPRAARSRGHPPGDQARAGGERARSTSSTCRRRRHWPRSRRPATRATTRSPRRARSTSSCPPTTSARPDFEGAKYVCSTPLRPQGAPGRAVAGAAHRRPLGGVHRPLPVLLQGAEGAGPRRLLQDPQRAAERRAPDGPAAQGRAWTGTSRGGAGSRSPAPHRPGCSGSTRARARSRRAPTPTS